jgi:hypothetical protein
MPRAAGFSKPSRRLQLEQSRADDPKHHEQHRRTEKMGVGDDNSCWLRHNSSTDEFHETTVGID